MEKLNSIDCDNVGERLEHLMRNCELSEGDGIDVHRDILTPDTPEINRVQELHKASSDGDIQAIETLLRLGLDINATHNGITTLTRAAMSDNIETVEFLIGRCAADMHHMTRYGSSCLGLVLQRELNSILRVLLRHGCNIHNHVAMNCRLDARGLDVTSLKLLIDLGLGLSCRETILRSKSERENGAFNDEKDDAFVQSEDFKWMEGIVLNKSVLSLQSICRNRIRSVLIARADGYTIYPLIELLPLPPSFMTFIKLK